MIEAGFLISDAYISRRFSPYRSKDNTLVILSQSLVAHGFSILV